VAILLFGCTLNPANAQQKNFEIQTISSRPDTVSGGDVLVRLRTPVGASWVAELNGNDVTSSFRVSEASRELVSLLTGLKDGRNTLAVRVGGEVKASVEIVNHPLAGPIFSGPHQEPFICQNEINGLGSPLDADCRAQTVIQYYYWPVHPAPAGDTRITGLEALDGKGPVYPPPRFKRYDPDQPPNDVAQTVTSEGKTVPYIVRREIGTINRAVYDIRFLHQPSQPLPTPWTNRPPAWNGRIVYEFGGGCGRGYRQGALVAPANSEIVLAHGYALASMLNIFGTSCSV
jgi:hypothetical protein